MRLNPYKEVPEKEWPIPPKAGTHVVKTRERVRQWLLNELASSYFFPRDWLTQRVVLVDGQTPNQTIPAGFFGFCLSTAKGDPFFWASLDTSQKPAKAEERLRAVLRHSPFSRLGISTDGTPEGTRCLRQRSNSDECDFVPDIEPFTVPEGLRLSTPYRAPGGKAKGHELEPISSSLEDVFFEAHSHIRDIDGLHADEALDELCKVLYAKLFDEEQTRGGDPYTTAAGSRFNDRGIRRLYSPHLPRRQ